MHIAKANYELPGETFVRETVGERKDLRKTLRSNPSKNLDETAEDNHPDTVASLAGRYDTASFSEAARQRLRAAAGAETRDKKDGEKDPLERAFDNGVNGPKNGGTASAKAESENKTEEIQRQIRELQQRITQAQAKLGGAMSKMQAAQGGSQDAASEPQTDPAAAAHGMSADAMAAQTEVSAAQQELNALTSQLMSLYQSLMEASRSGA